MNRYRHLQHAVSPTSIAIIGASATRGKWSNDVFRLAAAGFRGALIPVNPNSPEVEGVATVTRASEASSPTDYAIVVVPRDLVRAAVSDCVSAQIPVVHVLSSGFAEVSEEGQQLQDELTALVRGSDTVLIGSNSLGLYSARAGLNLAPDTHLDPGSITFVSQSGGLCYDVLMRAQARGLKFAHMCELRCKSEPVKRRRWTAASDRPPASTWPCGA